MGNPLPATHKNSRNIENNVKQPRKNPEKNASADDRFLLTNLTFDIIIRNSMKRGNHAMTQPTNEVLMNPIRMRIIQFFLTHRTATSAEAAAELSDIPRATLYRHISVLESHGYLQVVHKTRIRGATERTFALNEAQLADGGDSSQKAFRILMGLYRDFDRYFSGAACDPVRDYVFLKTDELRLTDAEYNEFLVKMLGLIKEYAGKTPDDTRKLRRFSLISSPTDQS